MNYADIENVWSSPHNRPTVEQLEQDKMKFAADLRRRRRSFLVFVVFVFGVLTLITVRFAVFAIWGGQAGKSVDIAREWGALIVLALPWAAAIFFARQYRSHRLSHADSERSISASVRALLDENRFARMRLKWITGLHAALLLVLPLFVYQLRSVGKAGDEILLPAFVIWPVIALGIVVVLRLYDRRRLLPRKRQLEALLETYK